VEGDKYRRFTLTELAGMMPVFNSYQPVFNRLWKRGILNTIFL